jgi:hypothetical protein
MFIGWENGPHSRKKRVIRAHHPRALHIAIAAATVLFLLFAYTW